jgi:hypothetical protein
MTASSRVVILPPSFAKSVLPQRTQRVTKI